MAEFARGARVRVRRMAPPGHVRTPHYLRGHAGEVERVLGPFADPEALAYGRPGARRALYRVRFRAVEVWGRSDAPGDTIEAEIYEHWLEPL
ncbi:SH3-like domain-containing protein [Jannaschia sp. W003]|uniref:SH3-like domain-containing protein n=1 Tax=Jannaschia sp. W003 TaxID=2867012 RepID=UPI0038FCC588